MICAYCGKEYEGSVCPQCGGKALAEENAIVCPYCDSVHTGGPRCNRCGADLLSIFAPPPLPEPPSIGKFRSKCGYMKLGENSLLIYKKHYKRFGVIQIPYSDIGSVVYKRAGFVASGFLSIRRCGSWKAPVSSYEEAFSDLTTMPVFPFQDINLTDTYEYLKLCAQRNQTRWILERNPEDPPFDMFAGYDGYIVLGEDAVTIHKIHPGGSETERRIPYREIREVWFAEESGFSFGMMALRSRVDDREISKTYSEVRIDDCAVLYNSRGRIANHNYGKLYEFLQSWAEKNRENRK